MSGFALVVDMQESIPSQDRAFKAFKESVAKYKQLKSDYQEISGQQYAVVKFDMPSTLHRGITIDEESGSWLLVVGTVLDSERDYNDIHLKNIMSDYLCRGNIAFQSLDGPFALVIYNKPADKLAIVSDPLGYISIFHAQLGERIYVATSSLSVAKAVRATPSDYGTYLFLTVGSLSGNSTLWHEVERLQAGRVLEITQTGATETVYWAPYIRDEITRLTFSETLDSSYDLFSWLLKHHLKREERMWADLTAGYDSRLLTMMLAHCGLPFKSTCEGPPDSTDVVVSSRIAKDMGWAYRHGILPDNWGYERYKRLSQALGKGDGHLDVFKLSKIIWDQEQKALDFKSSIWGHGGELWRGVYWSQEFLNLGRSQDVNYDRLLDYRIIPPVEQAVFRNIGQIKWVREELKSKMETVGSHYSDLPNTVKIDCVLLYKDTGFTGALVSAVMGQQRVIAPYLLKDSISAAISTNFKFRNHSRLIR